jgi:hypothetical protein
MEGDIRDTHRTINNLKQVEKTIFKKIKHKMHV